MDWPVNLDEPRNYVAFFLVVFFQSTYVCNLVQRANADVDTHKELWRPVETPTVDQDGFSVTSLYVNDSGWGCSVIRYENRNYRHERRQCFRR